MSLFEDLKGLGVDVDGGLKRINGNEKLYTKLLGTFTKSITTYHVEADFDGTDYNDVIEKNTCVERRFRKSFHYAFVRGIYQNRRFTAGRETGRGKACS